MGDLYITGVSLELQSSICLSNTCCHFKALFIPRWVSLPLSTLKDKLLVHTDSKHQWRWTEIKE